ncbi:MAG TPA: type 1 glutamine amidotransferase domain-containing protein [Candidatus Cybelea sp.]|jgi:protease I|nr:type 1 glutamine amidotransferase domain-containing protein [Candidatus Cybelea sp.]
MAQPPPLNGVRVAILVDDGFEQVELTSPRDALHDAGATTIVVSPQPDNVWGWNGEKRDESFRVDVTIADAKPTEFDALLIPGGVRSADALRVSNKAVLFVHGMQIARKPIAAICHAPWILIETGYVRGQTVTSSPSLRSDLINAGAAWEDRPVVTAELLVTSRGPADLQQFNEAAIALFTPRSEKTKNGGAKRAGKATR